jgi:hypothetical protein
LRLDMILNPIEVPVFLDQYFGQSFLHVPGSAEKFATLTPGQEGLAILAQHLEQELEAPIRVHLLEDSTAAPLLRRERDGIFLQIRGECDCKIHGNADEPGGNFAWENLLRQGDALYIPRGWWFGAAPGGVQVCFDIENPTGADLLDWLVQKVKQHEVFQSDIPRFTDPATKADYAEGLRTVLAQALSGPALFERFRRQANLKAQPQHTSEIPWSAIAPDDHIITVLTPRKIRIKRADSETILLVAIGKRLAFPEDAAPVLHYLADQAPVAVAELYKTFECEFDREELADLLAVLGKEGIIGVRVPDSI